MRKLIGTLIVGFFAAYFLFQFFGTSLLANALQSSLGVPVSVKRVHIKLAPVEFGLYGVKIASPKGMDFQEKEMFSLPEIFVRVNLLSIFKGKIQVQKVSLNLEHVTVEKSKSGKISLKEFLDLSKKKEAAKKPAPQTPQEPQKPRPAPKEKGPGLKLQVDEVTMSVGKVSYVEYAANGERKVREIQMNVDHMVLHDVTDMDSLSEQVVMIILKKIGMFVVGMQFDKMVNDAKTTLSNFFN